MTGRDLSGAMRLRHLVDHVVDPLLVIVVPWIVGMVWLSAYAVRFAFRVWEWVT